MATKASERPLSEYALGCSGLLVALTVGSALRGWALVELWGWFVSPLGPQPLGYWHALGLMAIWQLFTAKPTMRHERDAIERDLWRNASESAMSAIVQPLAALGFGWLLHAVML